jgi:hypothetical protein
MSDDITFDVVTTVPLYIGSDWIADIDVVALVRAWDEDGERDWEVTDWRYTAEDGSHRSLYAHQDTLSLKHQIWLACKAYEKTDSFAEQACDATLDHMGPLPDPMDGHRLTQRDFL